MNISTTYSTIQHPGSNHLIPVTTFSNERNQKFITANVSSDSEMLQVYDTIFLRNVACNQESRFVYLRSSEPKLAYMERLIAENTLNPLSPEFRVLCVCTENGTVIQTPEELPGNAYSTYTDNKTHLSAWDSTDANRTSQSRGISKGPNLSLEDIENRWHRELDLHTRISERDRIIYRSQTEISPFTTTQTPFQSTATQGVLDHLAKTRLDQLKLELQPIPPPELDPAPGILGNEIPEHLRHFFGL